MPRPNSIGILSAVFVATTLAAGVAGQALRVDVRKQAIPAITGVELVQPLLARGWPRQLQIYESQWGSPMKLRVGVANARRVEEVSALDKSSRPAFGFSTSFAALPLPDCGSGSSACVEVAVRPAGAHPGTYRIGVVADGRLLMLDPPLEMVCNPFRAPISLSLGPSHGLGQQGAASGRVRLGCPALPADSPKVVMGAQGATADEPIGNTVVHLRLAGLPLTFEAQQVVFPDSVIIQPGHTDAEFQAWAPEHLAPVNGRILHVDHISFSIRAERQGTSGAGSWALASTRFEYPRLDPSAFSIPSTIVGNQSVTGASRSRSGPAWTSRCASRSTTVTVSWQAPQATSSR